MTAEVLTVIVKIKPGEDVALERLLGEIGNDIKNNPYVRFTESRTIHFARWVILNDPENGKRLLFSSNYDGTLENHLNELTRIAPAWDSIWEKCEAYPGQSDLLNFINEHSYKAQVLYMAFRDETVENLRNYIAIGQYIQKFLNLKDVAKFMDAPGVKLFLDKLDQVQKDYPLWKKLEVLKTWIEELKNRIRALLLRGARGIVGFLGKPSKERPIGNYTSVKADIDKIQILAAGEDRIVQNQMSLLSDVQPERLLRLQIALGIISIGVKYLLPPGSLSDITSIHFAHWAIIDQGKRLVFVSNYDGSWENYLGDFIDKASDGLNSIWNNTIGYPEGGAQDIVPFKQYVREYQFLSQVFYSAYPDSTVQNLIRDRKIGKTIGANFDREATERWLELL